MSELKHGVVAVADTVQTKGLMHPLVERMLAKDPTPEALEKILKLQSDWEAAESKRAYTAALVELKKALPPFLVRDKTVDFTGSSGKRTFYTHTSLAGAMETVTPLLSDYGFSLTWKPGNNAKGMVTVTAKLTHRQGYSEESTLEAAPETGGNKSGPQAVASTVTLLARYACLGILGLATGDMAEPMGDAESTTSAEAVDTARNMRAMTDLAKKGKNKAEVEKFLGKSLAQWTAKDLDKLRAWIAPPAPKTAAAKTDGLISTAQVEDVRALVTRWKLTKEQFAAILQEEIGRKPAKAEDITIGEYEKLVKVFNGLDLGTVTLVNGKLIRPPEEDAPSTKSVEELNAEAKQEEIQF